MSVVYIVLPLALLLAVAAVVAFVWSVRSGQMDDLETPGLRVLIEEDDPSGAAPHDPISGAGGPDRPTDDPEPQ